MTSTQKANSKPLRTLGWLVATVLLLIGVWLAIAVPLVASAFGQVIPGVIALIVGFGVILVLRRGRAL